MAMARSVVARAPRLDFLLAKAGQRGLRGRVQAFALQETYIPDRQERPEYGPFCLPAPFALRLFRVLVRSDDFREIPGIRANTRNTLSTYRSHPQAEIKALDWRCTGVLPIRPARLVWVE